MSSIKLYFLQASRCIRTAWQLEELGLDYEVKFAPRENGVAPPAFKKEAGGLGKFPSLEDEGIMYYESGNICEYVTATSKIFCTALQLTHDLDTSATSTTSSTNC